jgi:anti-sigma factor RsiW
MTECENAAMRDQLPDFAADLLSSADRARVQAHVDTCAPCAAELALIRHVRAMPERVVSIDVASIVSRLPKPARAANPVDGTVIPIDSRSVARPPMKRSWSASRGVWRAAASIGVILVGGWSVLVMRSGGVGLVTATALDSANASGAAMSPVAAPVVAPSTGVRPTDSVPAATPARDDAVSVSFGGLSDYTDEELQRVLDRLDKWDGANSTETVTTTPILPIKGDGGSE